MYRAHWPLLALAVLAGQGVSAQSIIGRALDQVSNAPVVAADVALVDRKGDVRARSVTDSAGWFRLRGPESGKYIVYVTSIGYANARSDTVTLGQGVELQVELSLSSQVVPVAPLKVVAQRTVRVGHLEGYFQRAEWARKTGLGRIYTRDEVSRMGLSRIGNLLTQFPARSNCRMTYMLDGLPMTQEDIDRSVIPEDIEGVEIYRGMDQVPVEYGQRTSCGLVLVWTRADRVGVPFTWKRALVLLSLVGGAVFLINR